MRRIVVLGALCLLVQSAGPEPAGAQSNSASLTVSANVTKNCTISTAPVNFGAYDPVVANATTALDAIGTITVTCTKGAAAKVAMNAGSNAQGTTRRMSASASEFLTYEVYRDAARTLVWGEGDANSLDIPAAPSRNPRTFTAYGRVPAAQDATVGNYTDIVIATVNF